MREVNVLIDDFEKIKEFVSILDQLETHAILGQGNSAVDARSLIGVMSLAPKQPIHLTINENGEKADLVVEKIEKFLA